MCTTAGQPSRQNEQQAAPNATPGLAYLVLSAGSFAAASMAYLLDSTTTIDINRGGYALAACVSILGFAGWLARTSELRLQQYLDRRLKEHTEQITQAIRDTPPTVSYLPQRGRTTGGQTYRTIAAVAVGGAGDTVPLPTGMDPDTLAAVRNISRRLTGGSKEA